MIIHRQLISQITESLKELNKVIILYGARQVGKTTLIKEMLSSGSQKYLSINADDGRYNSILSNPDADKLLSLVSGYGLIFIDEAQRISNIGLTVKIINDHLPELKIILTGSSSLELATKVSEPLTGRKLTYKLYPIAFSEIKAYYNPVELKSKTEDMLIFGSYPEVFINQNYKYKKKILEEVGFSYLYKDIFDIALIKYKDKLKDLLKLLAFQVGSEVSINELTKTLGINRTIVERYIELLEDAFIIFRLSAFNRNLRKEISKMDKIYFYDLGIRNLLINNLNTINDRNDIGQLWENFLIVERKKFLDYNAIPASTYFWRTYTGAELDYIEESGGKLMGYEFKYKKTNARKPETWLNTYAESTYQLINYDNYFGFIS